jgi:Methyltransferase domain
VIRVLIKHAGVNRLRWIRKAKIIRQYHAPIHRHIPYILLDPEVHNFTYEIANRDELATWLDSLFGAGRYVVELDQDDDLMADLRRRLRWRPASKRRAPFGRRAGWYSIVRALRPARVVETGTHDGLGSTAILAALERNGFGSLISIDPQFGTGWLVPNRLRGRWQPARGTSYDVLPSVGPIDLFIHDSLHTPDCERWELETAAGLGAKVLLSDNAHAADTARKFASTHGATFSLWREQVLRHFYPGGGIGTIILPKPDRPLVSPGTVDVPQSK